MCDTINSMSNLKAFIRCGTSQELMYHLRNQIPNKEINTVHYTVMHKEKSGISYKKLSITKVLLSPCATC